MKTYKQWLSEAFTSPESKMAKKVKLKHGLLIVPQTHEAVRKYGCNTKWCLTYKEDSYWNDYVGDQKLTPYIVIVDLDFIHQVNQDINKNYEFDLSKLAVMVDRNNEIKHVWDATDENLTGLFGIERIEDLLKQIGVDINSLKSHPIEVTRTERDLFTKEKYNELIGKIIDQYFVHNSEYKQILNDDQYYNILKEVIETYNSQEYSVDILTLFEDDYQDDLQDILYKHDYPFRKLINIFKKVLVNYVQIPVKKKTIIKDK